MVAEPTRSHMAGPARHETCLGVIHHERLSPTPENGRDIDHGRCPAQNQRAA